MRVANTGGKSARRQQALDRKAKAEQLRRQQRAKDRRQNLLIIGGGAFIALALIAAVAVPAAVSYVNSPNRKPVDQLGVAGTAAGCQPEKTFDASKEPRSRDHVGPGSGGDESQNRVDYAQTPPVFGPHFAAPMPATPRFYSRDVDPPQVERLVHNLEHGYRVIYYDEAVPEDQVDVLEAVAGKIGNKIIVAPWDGSRGPLPDGGHVALSAWGANQVCAAVSGEAIGQFVEMHPSADAPEPNAA